MCGGGRSNCIGSNIDTEQCNTAVCPAGKNTVRGIYYSACSCIYFYVDVCDVCVMCLMCVCDVHVAVCDVWCDVCLCDMCVWCAYVML